jgi:sodium/potassium/calcium exchanger 6
MAPPHRLLLNCRRNAAGAAVASTAFLLLVVVLSVLLATAPAGTTVFVSSGGAVAAAPAPPPFLLPGPGDGGQAREEEEEEGTTATSCEAALRSLPDHAARCRYLSRRGHPRCAPGSYVDYLRVFYCAFGSRAPWLGAAAMALWLLVLFYLLGDTASRYFCASLAGLSEALRLPPAIAGVTLLSLGNGAPDVLSSVVAFAGAGDAGDVGLSSVLGGALFVSTVVAGVVALVAASREEEVVIERRGFVRDVCFLLVALCYLLAVLLAGTITVWAAASFLSLYAAYVLVVWFSHCCAAAGEDDDDDEMLLVEDYGKKPAAAAAAAAANSFPDDDVLAAPLLIDAPPTLPVSSFSKSAPPEKTFCHRATDALQSPLYLPRRLTIPDIEPHRWSKRYAVASAFLSPLLLAAASSPTTPAALLSALAAGALLAAAAAHTTTPTGPPTTRWGRLPWLAGGFLMSVLWSYLLARELVALLVAIGLAAGVKASVLGATVLAWGNSLGDLVADVAMAARGGSSGGGGGAQTAVSGCYAGPAFNTVVGLGLSLTMAAAARYPRPYAVPADASAYEAAGFLAAGLVWALVVLPASGMRLDRVLGVGLLVVYLAFIAVRLASLGGGGGGGS